jgi:hypothetical protein
MGRSHGDTQYNTAHWGKFSPAGKYDDLQYTVAA